MVSSTAAAFVTEKTPNPHHILTTCPPAGRTLFPRICTGAPSRAGRTPRTWERAAPGAPRTRRVPLRRRAAASHRREALQKRVLCRRWPSPDRPPRLGVQGRALWRWSRRSPLGGLAPTTGCGQAPDVGKRAVVPYTANSFFYTATRREEAGQCQGVRNRFAGPGGGPTVARAFSVRT
jgi:hypothetical protein